jgi:hypothetical protein
MLTEMQEENLGDIQGQETIKPKDISMHLRDCFARRSMAINMEHDELLRELELVVESIKPI